MQKNILLTVLLFLSTACTDKLYFTLGDTTHIEAKEVYRKVIAVEKVDIPKYLKDNSLVRQISPYQVELVKKANWLTPMQKRLTNVLISYLQKSLDNPNVYLYPWESGKNIDKRVALNITRFIAYKEEVLLEASYQIKERKKSGSKTKLFTTVVKIENKHVDAMVEAMEKAYFQLTDEIRKELIKTKV